MRFKYARLSEVTLSASIETGQREVSIPVLKQRSYTGRRPVISSSVAAIPCANLGVVGLLEKLNTILSTSHTLKIHSLSSLLKAYIIKDYDFGTVYGHLRPFWYNDLTDIEDELQRREAWDWKMRQDVLINDRIVNHQVPPRRVWDLYSNRVVPWWAVRQWPWVISHPWMKEEDRTQVLTPTNGFEWPVPMPKDANLDRIRIEMLNLGAEYVWLDVLCLRQEHGRNEGLRSEEWKLDVPTIGGVYRMAYCNRSVCYISGLGRPFGLKTADFESKTCWFSRAWTLQETQRRMIIGGDTGDDRFMEKGMRTRIMNQLSLLEEGVGVGSMQTPVFTVLSEMQKRVSTNPVDRVAGLSYLLWTDELPAYHAAQSAEDAWTALVDEMDVTYRGEIFFLYPKPGSGNRSWQPSWKQVMAEVLPPHPSGFCCGWNGFVQRRKENDTDYCRGPFIESGYVRGLAEDSPEGNHRQGELVVEDNTNVKHTFEIVADHQYPIPEGWYALLGSNPFRIELREIFQGQCWVIGNRCPGQMFKKVSVFQITNKMDVKRLHDLHIATKAETILA